MIPREGCSLLFVPSKHDTQLNVAKKHYAENEEINVHNVRRHEYESMVYQYSLVGHDHLPAWLVSPTGQGRESMSCNAYVLTRISEKRLIVLFLVPWFCFVSAAAHTKVV